MSPLRPFQANVQDTAEGRGVALERGEPDVGLARLQPSHGGLRCPHAGGYLGLGEPQLEATSNQVLDHALATRRHLSETREDGVVSSGHLKCAISGMIYRVRDRMEVG